MCIPNQIQWSNTVMCLLWNLKLLLLYEPYSFLWLNSAYPQPNLKFLHFSTTIICPKSPGQLFIDNNVFNMVHPAFIRFLDEWTYIMKSLTLLSCFWNVGDYLFFCIPLFLLKWFLYPYPCTWVLSYTENQRHLRQAHFKTTSIFLRLSGNL